MSPLRWTYTRIYVPHPESAESCVRDDPRLSKDHNTMSSLAPEEFDAPIPASVPLAELHAVEDDSAPSGGVSRRTLVKVAAWSAPVIAIVVGAPAAAASPNEPAVFSETTQSVSNPSLAAGSGSTNGRAKTTFTGADVNGDPASYQPGWVYTITSTAPFTISQHDATLTATPGDPSGGHPPYIFTFVVNSITPAVAVTAIPQVAGVDINFVIKNGSTQIGSATATPQP